MDSSLSKILKIFLGVLLLISVVFILMFYIGGKEEFTETPNNTNLILIWSYILLVITAAAAILFPIYALIKPDGKFLILPSGNYHNFLNEKVIIKGKIIRGKNLINGKIYIGATTLSLKHKRQCVISERHNPKIYRWPCL